MKSYPNSRIKMMKLQEKTLNLSNSENLISAKNKK